MDGTPSEIKDWVDYYSDSFYCKLFSALDVIGHLLNVRYELGIKQVHFHKVVCRLRDRDSSLYIGLNEIRESPAFREANRLRNEITHNYLPSSTGMSVTLTQTGGCIGIRNYTPSAAIVSNAREVIGLLERIVTLVTA